jgi:glyoxylase I family protein
MPPLGLHHVSINVDDVDTAIDFYVGVLGLEQRGDRPDFGFGGAWLDAGAQQVHLIHAQPPADLGQHFALTFEDLEAEVARLRQLGHTVSDPAPVGASLQAFLRDPSGNLVELHQPGAPAQA